MLARLQRSELFCTLLVKKQKGEDFWECTLTVSTLKSSIFCPSNQSEMNLVDVTELMWDEMQPNRGDGAPGSILGGGVQGQTYVRKR